MKRSFLSLLAISAAFLSLTACSGLPRSGGGGGGGGGSTPANLTLTLSDAPPANTSFVSFTLPINGITLTPVSGADVNVFSPSSTANFEATRLQSDSAQIGTGPFQVPVGTYIALNIFINNSPTAIWVNNSSSTILGCAPGQVCNLSGGAPGKIIINLGATLGGQGLVVTSGQNLAIGLDFNFANAITTSGGIGIDLRQAGTFTAVTLPRTGQATGSADSIEDFTGTVTAVSGNSITVTSATRGTLTGSANSSTVFNDPTGAAVATASCNGVLNLACVTTNRTISVDAVVSAAGAVTITEVDFIDLPSVDEIEGTVFPTSTAGQFLLVVSDKVLVSGNTILAPVGTGTQLNFTLDPGATFVVDDKNLPIGAPSGFAGTGDILPGQTVMIRVKSNSPTQGTLINLVTNRLLLRYSRLTGTVSSVSGNQIAVTGLPSFLGSFLTPPLVQTFVGVTAFDGVANVNSLAAPDVVSFRALYLHASPNFLAAKVRKH